MVLNMQTMNMHIQANSLVYSVPTGGKQYTSVFGVLQITFDLKALDCFTLMTV